MEIHKNDKDFTKSLKFDDIRSISDFCCDDMSRGKGYKMCRFNVEYDSEPMHLYLLKNTDYHTDDNDPHVYELRGLDGSIYLNNEETKMVNKVFREQTNIMGISICSDMINERNELNKNINKQIFDAKYPPDMFVSILGKVSIGPKVLKDKFEASEYEDYRFDVLDKFDKNADTILSHMSLFNEQREYPISYLNRLNNFDPMYGYENFIDKSIHETKNEEKSGIKSIREMRIEGKQKHMGLYEDENIESGGAADYFEDDSDFYSKNDSGFYDVNVSQLNVDKKVTRKSANKSTEKSVENIDSIEATKEKPMSSYAKLKAECERLKAENEELKAKNGPDMLGE